ncbi:unnamed protein product [Clonostachys rhizophaga]|uniref:Uncharacterized protein n=1 Tax=Clonostachys rhizophaga TaxID=160324 RepID=A0A9N9YSJ4_9HYPO|nr:unnamed protein product [Clonostachys rhizophaga]
MVYEEDEDRWETEVQISEASEDHSIKVINEREYKSLYDWCQLVYHHDARGDMTYCNEVESEDDVGVKVLAN